MLSLKFKVLYYIFSLLTNAVISLFVAKIINIDYIDCFLFITLGIPLLVWFKKIYNTPAYVISAYFCKKSLVMFYKNKFLNLKIYTAEDWSVFLEFFETDEYISNYVLDNPKSFAVALRYSLQATRDAGSILDSIYNSLACSKAINQIWTEKSEEEINK